MQIKQGSLQCRDAGPDIEIVAGVVEQIKQEHKQEYGTRHAYTSDKHKLAGGQ